LGDWLYVGNLSVENDLGSGGSVGAESDERSEVLDWLKRPPSGFLDFLVRTRLLVCGLSVGSFVLGFSRMFSWLFLDADLLASRFDVFVCCLSSFSTSRVGEDGRELDAIQDFLLSLERDRAGDMEPGESVDFRGFLSFLSCLGSTEESRLLLENGRNLDDRRELVGLEGGMLSAGGAVSVSGLDASDDVEDPPSPVPTVNFKSSSEMVPLSSRTADSSRRSLTWGKYV